MISEHDLELSGRGTRRLEALQSRDVLSFERYILELVDLEELDQITDRLVGLSERVYTNEVQRLINEGYVIRSFHEIPLLDEPTNASLGTLSKINR